MKMRRRGTIALLLFVVIAVGCSKAMSPAITDFGPQKTKAGQVFNAQPDGKSALWVRAENFTDTTVVMWDDKKLLTYKQPYGGSATVPRELYSKPGQYRISLLDTKTGVKSNDGIFTVE